MYRKRTDVRWKRKTDEGSLAKLWKKIKIMEERSKEQGKKLAQMEDLEQRNEMQGEKIAKLEQQNKEQEEKFAKMNANIETLKDIIVEMRKQSHQANYE